MSLSERTVRKIIREEILAHDKHKENVKKAESRLSSAQFRKALWELDLGRLSVNPRDEGGTE